MSIMGDEAFTPAVKTKQERIRDNQRRSRARRQEYLADLERRLSECHLTCREADLQKQAFGHLQLENARLRELLAYAGISLDLIESYLAQDNFPFAATDPNSSLRQIKPKMASADAPKAVGGRREMMRSSTGSSLDRNPYERAMSVTKSQQSAGTGTRSHHSTASADMVTSPIYRQGYSPTPMSMSNSPRSMGYTPTTPTASNGGYDWPYHQTYSSASPPMAPNSEFSYHSEHFHMTVNDPHAPAMQNAALYSAARDLVDKHRVKAEELEDIKHQLYPQVTQPAYPGPSCSVDNQVLFHVLNELSTRHN